MAQFLRIATETAPDLRESGIPDDVCTTPSSMRCAATSTPVRRHWSWGKRCSGCQARHGFPVDEMALCGEAEPLRPRV